MAVDDLLHLLLYCTNEYWEVSPQNVMMQKNMRSTSQGEVCKGCVCKVLWAGWSLWYTMQTVKASKGRLEALRQDGYCIAPQTVKQRKQNLQNTSGSGLGRSYWPVMPCVSSEGHTKLINQSSWILSPLICPLPGNPLQAHCSSLYPEVSAERTDHAALRANSF